MFRKEFQFTIDAVCEKGTSYKRKRNAIYLGKFRYGLIG